MNKQLAKDVNDIRNFILSFSIAKLQKELSESCTLSEFSVSDRILVIACRYSLDNFVKEKIRNGAGIPEINERYFMCSNFRDFKNNRFCFREVLIIGWENQRNDSGFDIRVDQILELNIKAMELHSTLSHVHVSRRRF